MRPTRPIVCLLVVLLGASAVEAASPRVRTIKPLGGRRGAEVEVAIAGEKLGDAREILFYQPGIEVVKLQAVDDAQVKATLKIAPDCRLGLHDLRLRTATGISALRNFSVGALPEVDEVEPNNDFAKPQPIAMNSTVNGVSANEDVDYFVVEAKKGDRISAEVEGIRLGLFLFDPYVAIMDARRFELASSDDASLVWQDAVASLIAPEDGPYIIQVRESAYAGNDRCNYRLHVGSFPRPTATLPGGGKLGEAVEVRWIGDVSGERTTTVTLPAAPDRHFGLFAEDDRGIAPDPNAFRLSPFGNVIEAEPNDDHASATAFSPPIALNGVIGKNGDVDHFAFKAEKGKTYDIKVYARAIRSPLDSVLAVAARKGGTLANNDDNAGSPDSAIRFNSPGEGEFVVAIRDQLLKGGPEYTYRIEVGPVEPTLTISPPVESLRRNRGSGAIAVVVPRGNRQAMLINATRTDFGGDLALIAEGLPEGVEMEAGTMAAGLGVIPVLFTARADAPVAGALATVRGRQVDTSKGEVPARFEQVVELVLGQNQQPFWTRSLDRLAVAVADEAPFSIEVVEPKVPLVRGGSMGLKVVARRKEGFKAAIAVSLPWNPPGLGSSGNVSIAEGADEALIPMNANDGAELKTWRIVVNGVAEGPTGQVMVSSPMASLSVAERFVAFAFDPVSVEQGKEADLVVKVAKLADFDGEAKVTLVGLPNKVTAEPRTITKETTELVFRLKTDPASPAGNHNNLLCQAVITKEGEPILHNLGTGKLRIDVPIAPKPSAASKPDMASAPKPDAPKPSAEKRLSRLEKLRLENQERAKAAAK